jgi:hypothetical protein
LLFVWEILYSQYFWSPGCNVHGKCYIGIETFNYTTEI